MEEEERLVTCRLCGINTAQAYLKRHIRFNHIINNDSILEYMIRLHEPDLNSIAVQTSITWVKHQSTTNEQAKLQSSGEELDEDVIGDKEITCSKCNEADFGSPMIACENCDSWYHSCCVGSSPRLDQEEWSCTQCYKNATNTQTDIKTKPMNGIFRSKDDENDIKITAVVKPTRKEILEKTSSSTNIFGESMFEEVENIKSNDLDIKKSRRSTSPELSPAPPPEDYEESAELADSEDSTKPGTRSTKRYNEFVGKRKVQNEDNNKDEPQLKKKEPERKKKRGRKKKGQNNNNSVHTIQKHSKESYDQGTSNKKSTTNHLPPIKHESEELVEVQSGKSVCKLCGLGWNLTEELELGPLYKYGVCQAHLHCLMFSSGLVQGGEDYEGILGFLPKHIIQEWNRGSELTCTFCNRSFATVGCCQKLCLKSYHLPCGIKAGAVSEYYGNFDSYCPTHKHRRKRGKNYVLSDVGLVPDSVDARASGDSEQDLSSKPKKKRQRKGNSSDSESGCSSNTSKLSLSRTKKMPALYDDYVTNGNVATTSKADTSRRSTGRVRKQTTLDQGIYKSAKDELAKMLQNKYVSIDSTFSNLTGRRRNVSHKIIKSRRRKGSSSSSTDSSFSQKIEKRKRRKISKRVKHDDNQPQHQEAETVAKIEQFLNESTAHECDDDFQHEESNVFPQNDGMIDNHIILSFDESVTTKKEPLSSDTSDDPLKIPDTLKELPSINLPEKVLRYRCSQCDYAHKEESDLQKHGLKEHDDAQLIVVQQEMKVILKKCVIRSPKRGHVKENKERIAELLRGTNYKPEASSTNSESSVQPDHLHNDKDSSSSYDFFTLDNATTDKMTEIDTKIKEAAPQTSKGKQSPISNISSLLHSDNSAEVHSDNSETPRTRGQKSAAEKSSGSEDNSPPSKSRKKSSKKLEFSLVKEQDKILEESLKSREPDTTTTNTPLTRQRSCQSPSLQISADTIKPASSPKTRSLPASPRQTNGCSSPRRSMRSGYASDQTSNRMDNSSESDSGGPTKNVPKIFQCGECSSEIISRCTLVMKHLKDKHNKTLKEYAESFLSNNSEHEAWKDIFDSWTRKIIMDEVVKHTFPDGDGHFKCDGCEVNFENKNDFKRHLPNCLEFPASKSSSSKQFTLLHSTIGTYSRSEDSSTD